MFDAKEILSLTSDFDVNSISVVGGLCVCVFVYFVYATLWLFVNQRRYIGCKVGVA